MPRTRISGRLKTLSFVSLGTIAFGRRALEWRTDQTVKAISKVLAPTVTNDP